MYPHCNFVFCNAFFVGLFFGQCFGVIYFGLALLGFCLIYKEINSKHPYRIICHVNKLKKENDNFILNCAYDTVIGMLL